MLLLKPGPWSDYELIDAGGFEKLERFGKLITIRPEPQAVWNKCLSQREWEQKAHVKFISKSSSSGVWQKLKECPEQWNISYNFYNKSIPSISFRLGQTSFKHVGIFPEQASNWEYIANSIKKLELEKPRFLNLFAYTGGASLAARTAGADVTHVDSIKQVITWARQNMELSNQDNIRWVIEDALKFVSREVKRGNTYHGIIMDPPAFGHGPNGEKWKIEDQVNELVELTSKLLDREKNFMILNAYSLGFSAIIIENLFKLHGHENIEIGELFLESTTKIKLPLGVFGRSRKLI